MKKVESTTENKAKTAKLVKILANAPKCEVVGKADARRLMFSIKAKRKVAKYAVKHNLKASVLASMYPNISTQTLRTWMQDNAVGRYHLKNAVSVSRA